MEEKLKAFKRLLEIIDDLRVKCPWDKKQTMKSLRNLTIEETYELADAILEKDMAGIKEELGDLMLHIVFYAKIASEKKAFDIKDVLNDVCDKLISRHPHIYGNVDAHTEAQVKSNWEKLKIKEGKSSVLEGVPTSLPALIKAYRIQEKAKRVGFEWENLGDVWKKVKEEMTELGERLTAKPEDIKRDPNVEEEYGDLMFALVNFARYINVDPENALENCNKKFIRRFRFIEDQAGEAGRDVHSMTLEEMDSLWEVAKKNENGN